MSKTAILELITKDQNVISSGRWFNGQTQLELSSKHGIFIVSTGFWNTRRGNDPTNNSDIDSSGGSTNAVFINIGNMLALRAENLGDPYPAKARLFNFEWIPGKTGSGDFWFRNNWIIFSWKFLRYM